VLNSFDTKLNKKFLDSNINTKCYKAHFVQNRFTYQCGVPTIVYGTPRFVLLLLNSITSSCKIQSKRASHPNQRFTQPKQQTILN